MGCGDGGMGMDDGDGRARRGVDVAMTAGFTERVSSVATGLDVGEVRADPGRPASENPATVASSTPASVTALVSSSIRAARLCPEFIGKKGIPLPVPLGECNIGKHA